MFQTLWFRPDEAQVRFLRQVLQLLQEQEAEYEQQAAEHKAHKMLGVVQLPVAA
jgi:hypothetical protein